MNVAWRHTRLHGRSCLVNERVQQVWWLTCRWKTCGQVSWSCLCWRILCWEVHCPVNRSVECLAHCGDFKQGLAGQLYWRELCRGKPSQHVSGRQRGWRGVSLTFLVRTLISTGICVNTDPRLALGEESDDDSRLMTICSRPCPWLFSSGRGLNYAVSALQRLRHVMSVGHSVSIIKMESKIEGLFSSTVAPRRRVFVGTVDSRDEEELVSRRYSNPLPPETTIVKALSFSPIAA